MKLYSTKNKDNFVDLKEAIFKGLPDDNGLFMPEKINRLPDYFFKNLDNLSLQEIAFEVCNHLFEGYINDNDLKDIIEKAINFPAPLVPLDNNNHVLELFHGPSLAFKDFGARFMAQIMSYLDKGNDKKLVILVATSGDTGGAVAFGFHNTPGIEVVILYPSGKVSMLQEKQLTTLGGNVTALEVDGTFDDCQALVKKAFLDKELTSNIRLSSANSINIARLIPQSFYYFEAYKQLKKRDKVVFSVPSGNFGNLTAGLFAKKMGLPIHHFIAATNSNDIVPAYLNTGNYEPKPSIRTLSNAMDVGNPSNFTRMLDLYSSTWNIIKEDISGYAYNDEQTQKAMIDIFEKYNYIAEPHGAVGYLALKEWQKANPSTQGVILGTAHPSKFIDDVERILSTKVVVPERLAILAERKKESILSSIHFEDFKSFLLSKY
jgi:threonine synthase